MTFGPRSGEHETGRPVPHIVSRLAVAAGWPMASIRGALPMTRPVCRWQHRGGEIGRVSLAVGLEPGSDTMRSSGAVWSLLRLLCLIRLPSAPTAAVAGVLALSLALVSACAPSLPPLERYPTSAAGVYTESSFDLDLLTHHFTRPANAPPPPGDKFSPTFGARTKPPRAPRIAGITRQAGPGDSFVAYGRGFLGGDPSDTRLWLYSQTTASNGTFSTPAILLRGNDASVIARVDASLPYGMYVVWVETAKGPSHPIRVNATDAWWVGPDHAQPGGLVSVYGRNLSRNNGNVESHVYLRKWASGPSAPCTRVPVTAVNPYKVTFRLPGPERLQTNEDYEVWVHNGHGGPFGWSGPLRLEVEENERYVWEGTVWDVTRNGVTKDDPIDDTAAIQAIVNGATSGDILYFPTGTYVIEQPLTITTALSIEGDGPSSVLRIGVPDFSPTPASASPITIAGFPARMRDLRIQSLVETDPVKKASIMFLGVHGTPPTATAAGLIIENLTYESPDGTSLVDIMVTDVNDVHVRQSHFSSGRGDCLSLGRGHQVFVQDNVFEGKWHDETQSGGAAVRTALVNELDMSGNEGRSLDTTNARRLDRLFLAGSPAGFTYHHYIGQNTTIEVGSPYDTQGEQIMFETPWIYGSATPSAVGTRTVTFSNVNFCPDAFAFDDPRTYRDPTLNTPAMLAILDGSGAGQFRRIESNTRDTIIIDRPWDVAPNAGSVLNILAATYRSVVFGNTLNGPEEALRGLEPEVEWTVDVTMTKISGSALDVVIADNTGDTLRHGVWLATPIGPNVVKEACGDLRVDGDDPANLQSGVLVVGNAIHNTVRGLTSYSQGQDPWTPVSQNTKVDVVFRGNSVTDSLISGIEVGHVTTHNTATPEYWQHTTLFDNNVITDVAKRYVYLNGSQHNTVMTRNQLITTRRHSGAVGILSEPGSSDPLIYDDNQWNIRDLFAPNPLPILPTPQ